MPEYFNSNEDQKKIAISTSGMEGQLIEINKLISCKANGRETWLEMLDGDTIISNKSLKKFEEVLVNYGFIRIHHSYLINRNHIKGYRGGKSPIVIMNNGNKLGVSLRRRAAFFENLSVI